MLYEMRFESPKMRKNAFAAGEGSARTSLRAYSAPPDPIAGFGERSGKERK